MVSLLSINHVNTFELIFSIGLNVFIEDVGLHARAQRYGFEMLHLTTGIH